MKNKKLEAHFSTPDSESKKNIKEPNYQNE